MTLQKNIATVTSIILMLAASMAGAYPGEPQTGTPPQQACIVCKVRVGKIARCEGYYFRVVPVRHGNSRLRAYIPEIWVEGWGWHRLNERPRQCRRNQFIINVQAQPIESRRVGYGFAHYPEGFYESRSFLREDF